MHIVTKIFMLVFCFSICNNISAKQNDCKIEITIKNEKTEYQTNDTLEVMVKVQLDEEFCDDAGEKTKVFCTGLKIINRSMWKKISPDVLGQKLTLAVYKNNLSKSITAYRKNVHHNCFAQKIINVEEKKLDDKN